MNERIRQLRERKAQLVADMRSMVDGAEGEKRSFNQEEETRYNTLFTEMEGVGQRIDREEKLAAEEQRLNTPIPAGSRGGESPATANSGLNPIYKRALDWLARRGIEAEAPDEQRLGAFGRYMRGGAGALSAVEKRDLQVDSDTAGGFLVPPQEFSAALIQAVDDVVWIRQFATIETITTADSLGIASLDADPADSDWTSEIGTGNADTTMKFGKRELRPHPLAKSIKISNKLIRASKIGVEAKVIERLSYKFGVSMEKAYLSGTGAEQPLGVFTATADGISTARDVATGNTSTAIGADGLIEAKYKLKGNYWPRARWIFHRDALKAVMKLKDTNGQYLWATGVGQRGFVDGQPDTLIGLPVHLSEYAPNTFTTGKYVGIVADFSRYGIVDSLLLQFQRLIELYAATNQIGYIGRVETDGMPLLEEAFARVTLA